MKKLVSAIILITVTIIISKNIYTSNKCTDIDYAVTHYFTTGIFNKYKVYDMQDMTTSFSNGAVAFIKFEGISSRSPHRKVGYTVFLEKNNRGVWKVKKVYPAQVTLQQDAF
ncbi:hypothetical protein [Clostridium luticellarii]|jgi:hypothetical protein|uniref:DUF4829 domain-containing protein n=1 Tax=Clostridium luticellarii TaxID=1691940 RepID=A0A2T0BC30_9CLOT|nr:hypothetical protein [Clostridium luticellarii]MCI1944502.1 hypothetical protein [Clostridium luticellarii]MCI1968001.1 hypothetical protein [Clostridium luticellarii]MCI1995060.1 hypothetical protein [Clostridium luticellarii]MCI2039219.1 hypothetical protein [Clostridium luticellarii]PRR81367.1 hypothetical protein CLLU_31450 [Clostridium luticellarii]